MKKIKSLIRKRTIWGITKLLLGIILLFSYELSAQDELSVQEDLGFFERRDSVKTAKIEQGKGVVSFLGGPAYTPELKLLIAAGGLYTFKTNREDSLIQRSSLNFSFGLTSTGGQIGKLILTSFWKEDKVRIYMNLWFKNIPDNYWGVGIDNGLNTPKSDSTTAYHRLWYQIYPRFLFRLKKNLYIGPVLDFNFTKGSDESPGVLADPTYQQFGPKNFNGGAGVILQFDSRDIPVNAYRGSLIQVIGAAYGGYLGGNNQYYLLDIDLRKYFQVAKIDGQTMAFNVRTRFTADEVPWGEMSQLGTPMDLRGYYWGRFRDESMLYAIAEYRHMFMRRSKIERSKHGIVGWLAAGTIMEDITQMETWLPNFGIGYRFEVQPRMNLRLDFGFGREEVGFYFNFTEAF
jgi:hypothetical protein